MSSVRDTLTDDRRAVDVEIMQELTKRSEATAKELMVTIGASPRFTDAQVFREIWRLIGSGQVKLRNDLKLVPSSK